MSKKQLILAKIEIEQKLIRMAYEIYEKHIDSKQLLLAGIDTNGYILAKRIAKILSKISPIKTELIKVIIDKKKPINCSIQNNDVVVKNASIILIDDVLNSGKTISYALKAFLNITLKSIYVAVLVNRNHTTYPIKADFVGLSLSTTLKEIIEVILSSKEEAVYLK